MKTKARTTKTTKKQRKGFRCMAKEDVTRIARMGGRAVSRNKKWMACIGSLGGTRSGQKRREAEQLA